MHNFLTQVSPNPELDVECSTGEAVLLARFMQHLETFNLETGMCFGQQCLFDKGIKVFGERGWKGARKEVTQLHDRGVFHPRLVSEMT